MSSFRFGGRLALDLTWTFSARRQGREDLLTTPEALGRWLVEAGLVDRAPAVPGDVLDGAADLRAAIYGAAAALAAGERLSRAHVATVNAWARRPPLAPQLTVAGTLRTVAPGDPGGTAAAALADVARDAVDLLTGDLAGRIRRCGREGCLLLFVDASRPGRRRWCSAAGCGNVVNAARYRARQREPSA